MTRTEIRGLKWARLGPQPPYIQQKRQRGAKARGLAFERKVGKHVRRLFPDARLGQWIYFEDSKGTGVAQPDILVETPDTIYIIECKLTYRPDAESKLRLVYGTLFRRLHPGRSLAYLQVFHNYGSFDVETVALEDAFEAGGDGRYKCVQL